MLRFFFDAEARRKQRSQRGRAHTKAQEEEKEDITQRHGGTKTLKKAEEVPHGDTVGKRIKNKELCE